MLCNRCENAKLIDTQTYSQIDNVASIRANASESCSFWRFLWQYLYLTQEREELDDAVKETDTLLGLEGMLEAKAGQPETDFLYLAGSSQRHGWKEDAPLDVQVTSST